MISRVRRSAILAAVAPVLALAACGGGASKDTASAGRIGGPITKEDVARVARYVGATPGKATKSPITLGLITVTAGPIKASGPSSVTAAQKLVNEHLGGIDGHPIVFKECATGASDQQAQACGEMFRNDPAIKAVIDPALPVGGLALFGGLGGAKPTFCAVPGVPEMYATNVFCISGGVLASLDFATFLSENTNAKSLVQILPDNSVFRGISTLVLNEYKNAGLGAKAGYIPLDSPDVTSALVASGVRNAQAIALTLTNVSQCIAVAKAFKTLGVPTSTPVIALPACADPAVARALGDKPKWIYFNVGEDPFASKTPDMNVFRDAVHTYDGGRFGVFGNARFAAVIFATKILNQVGPANLTPARIAAAARAYRGPIFLGDPDGELNRPPFRNAASMRARAYRYEGNGTWTDATGGKWIEPPRDAKSTP
jgi:branched-chain amino acid transport system substrate-binding protein